MSQKLLYKLLQKLARREIFCYNKTMPFRIVRNDITKVHADAIVNTANPFPTIGKGTDTSVYNAAGREELLRARQKIGVIEPGHSVATKSFALRKNGIKYIIHTVGNHYDSKNPETVQNLRKCYSSSLELAQKLKCKSIAIPLLATGYYGFPKELGLKIAVEEISSFLLNNDIDTTLVVYDPKSYMISEKLFDDIQDFLEENYEGKELDDELETGPDFLGGARSSVASSLERNASARRALFSAPIESNAEPIACFEMQEKLYDEDKTGTKSKPAITPIDLDSFIRDAKEPLNFQNTLQQLIADRKLENAAVYKKACIDKKFFSKIISNKDYVPKKHVVMALGLALELPLTDYEHFLASAGYAFMPSSKFDLIVKYCVMKQIYNLVEVDIILDSHGLECFAPA